MSYLLIFILLYFAWTVVVFFAMFYGHTQSLRENPPEEDAFDLRTIPEWFDIGSIVQKPMLNGADFITDILVIMQMSEKDGKSLHPPKKIQNCFFGMGSRFGILREKWDLHNFPTQQFCV